MQTPWMLITGCSMIGFMLPEVLASEKRRVPFMMNILSAVASGLIAASFVIQA